MCIRDRHEAQAAAAAAEAGSTEEKAAEEEKGIDIEPKEEITFDDFEKLQFQVGEIIACEAVKKSKKLLCSQVKICLLYTSCVQKLYHASMNGFLTF